MIERTYVRTVEGVPYNLDYYLLSETAGSGETVYGISIDRKGDDGTETLSAYISANKKAVRRLLCKCAEGIVFPGTSEDI